MAPDTAPFPFASGRVVRPPGTERPTPPHDRLIVDKRGHASLRGLKQI
jgi:hypothetical protein